LVKLVIVGSHVLINKITCFGSLIRSCTW
jgi:hypothetical protein